MAFLPRHRSHLFFFFFLNAVASMAVADDTDSNSKKCFKRWFNFGDSNSDTGAFWSMFPPQPKYYGMTHFGNPSYRDCDGKMIIDFLAEGYGYPYMSPYLEPVGANFTSGVNFATSGSTVFSPSSKRLSPFSLAVQVNQMKDFKTRVDQSHSSGSEEGHLPSPSIFGIALYMVYIGQNDLNIKMNEVGGNETEMRNYFPQVIFQITSSIKELYNLGGRTFVVYNMAPLGCHPSTLAMIPHTPPQLDPFGCYIPYNNLSSEYNALLKEKLLNETRVALPKATIIYLDIYSILIDLYQRPENHGLKYGTRACCGVGGGEYNFSPTAICGRTDNSTPCADPQNYVSWDGIHTSDAANKIVAASILSGNYSIPPIPIHPC